MKSLTLAALTEKFYRDCQPQNVIESTLVETIVRASWPLHYRRLPCNPLILNPLRLRLGSFRQLTSEPPPVLAAQPAGPHKEVVSL